jgi:oligopeptidase B
VFEEPDDTFNCNVDKTKSKQYLLIFSEQALSTEVRILDADRPQSQIRVSQPRQRDVEYAVDHHRDHFYIRTNFQAKNSRLMKTPVARTAIDNWQEVLPTRADVFLAGFELFDDYLVAVERRDGLLQLRVMPWTGPGEHSLDFGEATYFAAPRDHHEPDSHVLRYVYSSLTTPWSVYDYDLASREKKLLKRDEVLAGFDPHNYRSERLYAIAHVRGGQELGRAWFEDGKLPKKKNTFTDFIACAEHLVQAKIADPKRIFAQGASAGGLLMGAIVNMRPELFRGVIANVPWVDVVTTMLDDSIPLTTSEYDEWGNPNDPTYYEYMLSYSPYDQVRAQAYPNLLVTTSLQPWKAPSRRNRLPQSDSRPNWPCCQPAGRSSRA